MMFKNSFGAVCSLLLVFCGACPATAADPPKVVWIYHDQYNGQSEETLTETQKRFSPYGFMPAERAGQISVNPSLPLKEGEPEMGTCIEYSFQFKNDTDWQGVYHLVGGNSWGTKPGIDVGKLLGIRPEDKVVLKFIAWGEGTVTFQCGGVNIGPHRSSLRFPKTTETDPIKLTKTPREYEIEFSTADAVSRLCDPFCIIGRASDNREKGTVTAYVREIRFEVPSKAKQAGALRQP